MKDLLRRTYKINLTVKRRFLPDKNIIIPFSEGSLEEILSLMHIFETSGIFVGVLKFLSDHGLPKKYEKHVSHNVLYDLYFFVLETYCYGYIDVKKLKNKMESQESSKRGKKEQKEPEASFIMFLLENSNETIESLLRLTWRQVEFMKEGIIWNLNSQTKKGQERNAQKMRMDNSRAEVSDDEALERAKALREKIRIANSKKSGVL